MYIVNKLYHFKQKHIVVQEIQHSTAGRQLQEGCEALS